MLKSLIMRMAQELVSRLDVADAAGADTVVVKGVLPVPELADRGGMRVQLTFECGPDDDFDDDVGEKLGDETHVADLGKDD